MSIGYHLTVVARNQEFIDYIGDILIELFDIFMNYLIYLLNYLRYLHETIKEIVLLRTYFSNRLLPRWGHFFNRV